MAHGNIPQSKLEMMADMFNCSIDYLLKKNWQNTWTVSLRIIVWLAAYPLTGVEMLPGENAQDGQSLPRAVESIVQAEQELK